MLINDGVVEAVFVEDKPGEVTGSGAPAILMALEASRV
jgi:peroxiredoxin